MTIEHRERIKNSKSFYRDTYRSAIKKLLYVALLIVVLIGAVFFEYLNMPEPNYYATSSDGALVPLSTITPSVIQPMPS